MIKIWQLIQINYQIIRLSSMPDFIFIRNALGQSTLQELHYQQDWYWKSKLRRALDQLNRWRIEPGSHIRERWTKINQVRGTNTLLQSLHRLVEDQSGIFSEQTGTVWSSHFLEVLLLSLYRLFVSQNNYLNSRCIHFIWLCFSYILEFAKLL